MAESHVVRHCPISDAYSIALRTIVIREKIEEQKEKLFENISNIKEWIVLELKTDALNVINRYLSEKKQSIIKSIENLWDKYQVSLKEIENQRDEATNEIKSFLSELGYL